MASERTTVTVSHPSNGYGPGLKQARRQTETAGGRQAESPTERRDRLRRIREGKRG